MQGWFLVLIAAGLSLPTSVNADGRPAEGSLAPGARIRVWQRDRAAGPILGTLLELEKGELTLRGQDRTDPLTIPLQAVSRIDVSLGRRGNAELSHRLLNLAE